MPSKRSSCRAATIVGLAGSVLANTPDSLILLGLNGAGGSDGNPAALVGPFIYLGCLLEILCGTGEWYRGDIFNAAVFFSVGGYFGSAGATMLPFYYAMTGYGTGPAATAAYHNSYAMFLISMAILLLLFTVASFAIDISHVLLFTCFTVCFPCLAVSHVYTADENDSLATVFRICAGSMSLVGTVIAWYLASIKCALHLGCASKQSANMPLIASRLHNRSGQFPLFIYQ